jgi:hypothetical protein
MILFRPSQSEMGHKTKMQLQKQTRTKVLFYTSHTKTLCTYACNDRKDLHMRTVDSILVIPVSNSNVLPRPNSCKKECRHFRSLRMYRGSTPNINGEVHYGKRRSFSVRQKFPLCIVQRPRSSRILK